MNVLTTKQTSTKRKPRLSKEQQQFASRALGAGIILATAAKISSLKYGSGKQKSIEKQIENQCCSARIQFSTKEGGFNIMGNEVQDNELFKITLNTNSLRAKKSLLQTVAVIRELEGQENRGIFIMHPNLYDNFCKQDCFIKVDDLVDPETNLCAELFTVISNQTKIFTLCDHAVNFVNKEQEIQCTLGELKCTIAHWTEVEDVKWYHFCLPDFFSKAFDQDSVDQGSYAF